MIWSDPVIRAPLYGSMILALSISLLGGLLFVRKRTLLGEVLSHATYPGVAFALFFSLWLSSDLAILFCATCSALLGLGMLRILKSKLRVAEDTALCFVLATFFGIGTLLASLVQATHPALFRQIPLYLYGQAATMEDSHVLLYACFALFVICGVILCYRPLLLLSFDRAFASSSAFPIAGINVFVTLSIALAVVLGMRSLGIILLSALLIAPPIAARQWTQKFSIMLILSACFGVFSGFLGTLISLTGLPTGPCVVLVATGCALLSLAFAPQRGLVFRQLRIFRFRWRAQQENLLKRMWAFPEEKVKAPWWVWYGLRRAGWVEGRHVTPLGKKRGARIVRLHRLWEAYLVHSLGMGVDQVHHNAEEMEHVLTPELEKELARMLDEPRFDPHAQPIPEALYE